MQAPQAVQVIMPVRVSPVNIGQAASFLFDGLES
jgi:hypothetical protein